MNLTFSFFPGKKITTGRQSEIAWADAVSLLTKHDARPLKDGELFSAAMYEGVPQRADANVKGVCALIADFDNSVGEGNNKRCSDQPSLPDTHFSNLDGLACVWYSSYSNDEKWPRWRLVIPFDRIVSPTEWPIVFSSAMSKLFGDDSNIDRSCSDLSRSYWLPSCPPWKGQHKFAGSQDGESLRVDWLLEDQEIPIAPAIPQQLQQSTQPVQQEATAGRNNKLKSIVMACLANGEPLEKIVADVYEYDQKHHNPPLFSDESEGFRFSPITNALKFVTNCTVSNDARRRKANLSPELPLIRRETGFAAIQQAPLPSNPETLLSSLGIFSWGEEEESPAPMPVELWGPRLLIEGGRLLIAGAPKIGKTDYLQSFAMAAATGSKFLDWTFARPLKVLYLQAELNRPFFAERIRKKLKYLQNQPKRTQTIETINPETGEIIEGDGIDAQTYKKLLDTNLICTGRMYMDLLHAGDCDKIYQVLQIIKPELILIDPVINFSTANENENTEVARLFANINYLAMSVNAAAVVAHHVRKAGGFKEDDDPFDLIRGASAFRGWYDSGVMLYRKGETVFTAYEMRYGAQIPACGLITAMEDGEWRHQMFQGGEGCKKADREFEVSMDDPRIATVLEILAGFPAGLTAGEWNEKVKKHFKVSDRTAKGIRLKAIEHAGIDGVGDGTTKLYRYDRRRAG